jgi:serine O-acetyltransferase
VSEPARDQTVPPPEGKALPRGDRNMNPAGLSWWALVREDFRTHDRSLLEPGFWAVATHRFGNARMGVRWRLLRAPLTLVYALAYRWCEWIWGIKLSYTVKVGRRVRIWHHGGMILGAREIGDDVHIRQNTTFGIATRRKPWAKPTIGAGVEIGAGAVIVGDITVGAGSLVGANSVVTRDVPPRSVVIGVPAQIVRSLDDPRPGDGP